MNGYWWGRRGTRDGRRTRHLRRRTCRWRGRLMHDRLRLYRKGEGLLRSLMRLASCNDMRVVVSRFSWRVGSVVSSHRNMRQPQLITLTRWRLYRRVDRSHVSRLTLRLGCDLDRLDVAQLDGVISGDPELGRRHGRSRGLNWRGCLRRSRRA